MIENRVILCTRGEAVVEERTTPCLIRHIGITTEAAINHIVGLRGHACGTTIGGIKDAGGACTIALATYVLYDEDEEDKMECLEHGLSDG